MRITYMSFYFGAQCVHRIPGLARWVDLTDSIRSESDEGGHGCDSIQESRPKSYQTFWSLAAPQVPSAIRGSKSGRSGHETTYGYVRSAQER